jgi:type II secretory pathway pseudopilin PulG
MALNGISELATKELRQKSKLDLAATKRATDGYARSTYDITQLPTQYNDNAVINNPNAGGLVVGRPWINTTTPFTFYEAFGTTTTISTTQYVSGNKIYAESSSYDVSIPAPPARVVVNDIEVLRRGDTPNPPGRGHNLVVLDTYGDVVVPATQFDTYIDPANLTALASALDAVASGNIVVLVAYDASALDAGVRSAINTGYGSTNTNTWTAERRSHIFIGIKL